MSGKSAASAESQLNVFKAEWVKLTKRELRAAASDREVKLLKARCLRDAHRLYPKVPIVEFAKQEPFRLRKRAAYIYVNAANVEDAVHTYAQGKFDVYALDGLAPLLEHPKALRQVVDQALERGWSVNKIKAHVRQLVRSPESTTGIDADRIVRYLSKMRRETHWQFISPKDAERLHYELWELHMSVYRRLPAESRDLVLPGQLRLVPDGADVEVAA